MKKLFSVLLTAVLLLSLCACRPAGSRENTLAFVHRYGSGAYDSHLADGFTEAAKALGFAPTVVTPAQALYAATRAGALAQGRSDCGLLKVGFRADLIVMDLRNKPHMYPCHNMLNNVVFAAQGSDVCLTMVDGQVLYRDGLYTTLDIESVIAKANESTDAILRQL